MNGPSCLRYLTIFCLLLSILIPGVQTLARNMVISSKPHFAIGPMGAPGPIGAACVAGVTGAAGAKGDTGVAGVQGPAGATGLMGATGSTGQGLSCIGALTNLVGSIQEAAPNVYFMCENTSADIRISQSNVVFDLHGYALTGCIILDSGLDNVIVKNGVISSKNHGVGVGIDASGCTNCQFRDLVITGFGAGIYLHSNNCGYASNGNKISMCTCDENEYYGIHLENSHDNTIESCICRLDRIGIGLVGCYGNSITGCTCEASTSLALNAVGLLLDSSSYNRIFSCTCVAWAGAYGAAAYGIHISVHTYNYSASDGCSDLSKNLSYHSQTDKRFVAGSNNTIISCVVGANALSGNAIATGIYVGGSDTSIMSCRIDAISEANDAVGVKLCGMRNIVDNCTVAAETRNPQTAGTDGCAAISLTADEQTITACHLKATTHSPMTSKSLYVTSSANNIQACTCIGTSADGYGALVSGCSSRHNDIVSNIFRGTFKVSISLGQSHDDGPQGTVCKNNSIEGIFP